MMNCVGNMMNSVESAAKTLAFKPQPLLIIHRPRRILSFLSLRSLRHSTSLSSSSSSTTTSPSPGDAADEHDTKPTKIPSKSGSLGSGLYLVATPIGNLEDITLRALRVLKSADVILAEDTRHSRKLLQHYDIKTPLLSYHKFNESQREAAILRRLQEGQTVALISDAGTPGISDPGAELAKLCVVENIPVIPIPGPSALLAALSASGLPTNEFTFVGFLPKHAGSRREKLLVASNQTATQLFFVPPHKLQQFLSEALPIFGDSRICVIARELTKIHEEFWRGSLEEANTKFSAQPPKGEITVIIEGKRNDVAEIPSEGQLEHDLRALISNGHSISMAVKLVTEGTSAKRKHVYALALRLFGKHMETEGCSD